MSDKKPITPGFPDYPKAAADFDSLIRILTEERDRLRAEVAAEFERGRLMAERFLKADCELAEARGLLERIRRERETDDGVTWETEAAYCAFLDRTAPPPVCSACGKTHRTLDCPIVSDMPMTMEGGDPPEPAPQAAPRRCAACDEPWPHPGKLCEPQDVAFLAGSKP